jgi:hypothetical protein
LQIENNDDYNINPNNDIAGEGQNRQNRHQNLFDPNNDDNEDELDEDREYLRKKIGTKKLAKLEEKALRRERNELLKIKIILVNGFFKS